MSSNLLFFHLLCTHAQCMQPLNLKLELREHTLAVSLFRVNVFIEQTVRIEQSILGFVQLVLQVMLPRLPIWEPISCVFCVLFFVCRVTAFCPLSFCGSTASVWRWSSPSASARRTCPTWGDSCTKNCVTASSHCESRSSFLPVSAASPTSSILPSTHPSSLPTWQTDRRSVFKDWTR